MNPPSSKSFLKKIIAIALFLAIILLAGYFLFRSLQSKPTEIDIVNSSAVYQLSYNETPGFTAFLKQMASEYPARKSTKSRIEKINIVVSDISTPEKQIIAPIIPITVLISKETYDLKQLEAKIQADPANLQTFSDTDLTSSLFTSIVGQIYAITHPSKTIEERIDETNRFTKQLHASNSNPFVLIKK
ncbi:MAG: hypothetical protein KBC15_00700 [Candidatus Levybacteria bacterium]|nr:hypothetical protein [Candidatus Levybacteria bacterium]